MPSGAADPLLEPFLAARDEREAAARLERVIVEHARPTIAKVLARRLGASLRPADPSEENQDALDLRAEVEASLIEELGAARRRGGRSSIESLVAYAAQAAANACADLLRRRHPERARLKNRLRYMLGHRDGLALWRTPAGELAAGRACDREAGRTPCPGAAVEEAVAAAHHWAPPRTGVAGSPAVLARLLEALFAHLGSPVELDDLTGAMAALLGIAPARRPAAGEEDKAAVLDSVPDPAPGGEERTAWRELLALTWREVRELPEGQRAAVLLNLRDGSGEGCIELLPAAGIATVEEIGRAAGLDPAETAGAWDELPWPDDRIAARLGLSRQQVINLRKSARARLGRRLAAARGAGRRVEW